MLLDLLSFFVVPIFGYSQVLSSLILLEEVGYIVGYFLHKLGNDKRVQSGVPHVCINYMVSDGSQAEV